MWAVDWKKFGYPHCSIYIIAPEGHWPCKVGISQCARKRVQGLQTSHWKMLTVAKCFWAPTVHDARRVEQKTHEMLKDENCFLLGEWFDKTPEKAAEVVEFAAMSIGVELADKVPYPEVMEQVGAEMELLSRRYRFLKSYVTDASAPGTIDYTTGRVLK